MSLPKPFCILPLQRYIIYLIHQKSGEWGYISTRGDFVIPPTFDSASDFHDGLVRFVENGKFGYKDGDGNVVVKPQFFEATDSYIFKSDDPLSELLRVLRDERNMEPKSAE